MSTQQAKPETVDTPDWPAAKPADVDAATASGIIEARAISEELTKHGVPAVNVGYGTDPVTNAPVVRVDTAEGLIALAIPPVGEPYVIQRGGQRLLGLQAVRRPRAQVTTVARQFAGVLQARNLV
ncbi:hypothetical protein ACQEU8_36280 [Streptomyces sp. CA-250714]|uniref:hypothetical protein n=1 Tax=Streptomyces sp. CA-250714 TaxID=3240060 RepID=UPI003D8C5247